MGGAKDAGGERLFDIEQSWVGSALVLTVSGEVDMHTAPALTRALDAGHNGTNRVVAELSALDFLDSSGMNALVESERQLAARDVELRVVAPADSPARRVLDIAQLVEALHVVDTLDEAVT